MRILAVGFVLLVGVSAAFGAVNCAALRIPEECYPARTFGFATPASTARLYEIVQILKTSLVFANVDVDSSASTVTVRGSEEKLAMTDWLLRELDQPAAKAASRMDRYEVSAALQKELGGPLFPKSPDASDQVMGVFFLAHLDDHGVQELRITLTIVGNVGRLANDNTGKKLVVRGTEAQSAMAKYLIGTLDVAPGTATTVPDFRSGAHVVRVFFTDVGVNLAARRQILIALHDVVGIQHVFDFSAPAAIAVRGSADEIAAADWLIRSLGPGSSAGAHEFRLAGTDRPDNLLRMFYEPHTRIDTMKSSGFDSPVALLVRGSASQIAAAEQVLQ